MASGRAVPARRSGQGGGYSPSQVPSAIIAALSYSAKPFHLVGSSFLLAVVGGVQRQQVVAHRLGLLGRQLRAGDDVLDRHRLRRGQHLAALGLPGLDHGVGRGGTGRRQAVLDEERHRVLVAGVDVGHLLGVAELVAHGGAHHPRGDRILVRRAQLAALQVGQRLQRRIGRHQEVGLVVLEALGHDQQLVVGLLDGLDRQVRRVHQRQVVGLVGQALAQAGVVGHRLDLHRLLQQLAQVGGDGGVARADLVVRHAVGHALVDGEDQVGLGQAADGGQDSEAPTRR